jgi:ABC-type lipoprotein release transport system permease subunit
VKYHILLAWRNLWRNRRRTLLATSSVFFATLLALLYRSTQAGQHDYLVQMSVSMYTGYLQVQARGYWDDRSFDYSMELPDSLLPMLSRSPHITTANPRIESVALISHATETRIAPVTGIDPESENAMSGLRKRIVKGSYLTDSSQGVLIAAGLAERLQVGVGDSVVLFGQGYQGTTAAAQLPVEGIVQFPIPQLNNAMVFLSLAQARTLFNASGRVTSVSLMIDRPRDVDAIQSEVAAIVRASGGIEPIPLVVMNWREMSPEVVQAIEADVAGEVIIMFILYAVIGFGVFGTVMMMTLERTREFGLLLSLGMKRGRMVMVTTLEALFISMIGAAAGTAAAFPLLTWFILHPIRLSGDLAQAMIAYGFEPILPLSIEPPVFISQSLVVFVIAMITSLYPLAYIRNLRPVAALQGRRDPKR